MFAVPVPNRTADTLSAVMVANIKPKTVVNHDMFKAYQDGLTLHNHDRGFGKYGFLGMVVNHSVTYNQFNWKRRSFCDTNSIEGTWFGIKLITPRASMTFLKVGIHCDSFVWDRLFKNIEWHS